jgi:hypothetical protein
MPVYDTAINIINAASQELGIGVVSLDSASTGNAGFQLLGLLNALGSDLIRVHDWQNLEKTMTFTGDGVATTFALPADFGRQVNQTQWCASNRQPMIGPMTAQQWSWCQYGLVGTGIYFRYRILGNQYTVYPVPGVGEQFALYYISRNWVLPADQVAEPDPTYADKITNAADVPQFDARLLINGLKAKFWGQKGFDTTKLQKEFDDSLIAEKGQMQGAAVLSLSNSSRGYLIGMQNVPDGNWQVV